ncbi:hypothetical protein BOKEGFJH_00795 [Chlamydia avium]|uniref:Uncharacterized protein n=2 Tax=Chlamydia avium TaxID=1457141 RepID=W8K1H1_9CHLA|nr:hypothetical protein [Chlamydia avium]AHK63672.1 Uncharacterized protein M832_08230 [Chlamydia avium 10DC88]EPP36249.1 hypothetical protein CP10743SC13_0161 [Chlamydia psittaci 10_743_SC13]EPP38577.1 hypothetical protein CP10881SC42_0248 [Chlamydia avium]VVT43256.1 hypothetical protein BOKEGFJH_00795 [Chlamydia avium]
MAPSYFLALPLQEAVFLRFMSSAPRWSLFINNPLYLFLISYQRNRYLAKELHKFPYTIQEWEKHIRHVTSLLQHTFLCDDVSSLTFLACENFQYISLPS